MNYNGSSDSASGENDPDFNDGGCWRGKKFMKKVMDGKYKMYRYLKDKNAKGMLIV